MSKVLRKCGGDSSYKCVGKNKNSAIKRKKKRSITPTTTTDILADQGWGVSISIFLTSTLRSYPFFLFLVALDRFSDNWYTRSIIQCRF